LFFVICLVSGPSHLHKSAAILTSLPTSVNLPGSQWDSDIPKCLIHIGLCEGTKVHLCFTWNSISLMVRTSELTHFSVGVFIPNTRFLMAIFSVFFTLLLVCENVLLILDMNGVSVSNLSLIENLFCGWRNFACLN
jgi:hypothetical protein